ncbi:MAG TPA: RidA family protein [Gemmatimonadaceae bacterium]|nr:RidA family protein [Gemmatimonadaceae bacterium]
MSIEPEVDPLVTEIVVDRTLAERERGPAIVQPDGWPRPRGYSNGAVASGRFVVLAGQVGWNPITGDFDATDFVGQTRQALSNIVALLLEGGARPRDLVRLTWYIVDREEYLSLGREIGAVYRELIGDHYPPMSVVVVSGLIENQARLEIEATAVIPD